MMMCVQGCSRQQAGQRSAAMYWRLQASRPDVHVAAEQSSFSGGEALDTVSFHVNEQQCRLQVAAGPASLCPAVPPPPHTHSLPHNSFHPSHCSTPNHHHHHQMYIILSTQLTIHLPTLPAAPRRHRCPPACPVSGGQCTGRPQAHICTGGLRRQASLGQ
jgi:hypothetical protein